MSAAANLAPALGETFLVVGMGYIAAKFEALPDGCTGAMSWFASYVSLPALIFQALATVKLGTVNVSLLVGILIAKTTLFLLTALLNLVINKNRKKVWAIAGIRSIFVEQSNDLALGLPIVKALYTQSHPEFINYQFLLPVISLILLNPLGFVMIEIGVRKRGGGNSTGALVCKVLKNIVTNPVVLMVVLGLAWNLILGPSIPDTFNQTLTALSNSFDAIALFCLGTSMIGLLDVLSVDNIMLPLLLVGAKILIAPILSEVFVNMLGVEGDLSLFAFIYGTLPTAPAVFVWAKLYHVDSKLMAAAVVISTVIAAPVMLVTAQLASVDMTNTSTSAQVAALAWSTMEDASWGTVLGAGWVLVFSMLLGMRGSVYLQLVRLLCLCEMVMGISTLVCPHSEHTLSYLTIRFSFAYVSVLMARMYAAALGLAKAWSIVRGPKYLHSMRWWLYIAPLFISGVALAGSLIAGQWETAHVDGDVCAGGFGKGEDVSSTIALGAILLVLVAVSMPIVKRGAAAFSTRKQYVRQLVDKEKKDRVQVVVKRPGGRNEESLSTAASGLQYSLSSGRDGRSKSANVGTTVSSGSGGTDRARRIMSLLRANVEGQSDVPARSVSTASGGSGSRRGIAVGGEGKAVEITSPCDVNSSDSEPEAPSAVYMRAPASRQGYQPPINAVGGGVAAQNGGARRRGRAAPHTGPVSAPAMPSGESMSMLMRIASMQAGKRLTVTADGGFAERGEGGASAPDGNYTGPSSAAVPLLRKRRYKQSQRASHHGTVLDGMPAFMHAELRATHNRVLFIVMYHACGILVALCRMVLSYVEGKHVNATEAELQFLDLALNYGQGIVTFLIFGVGDDLVQPLYAGVRWLYRAVRRMIYSTEHVPTLASEVTGTDQVMEGESVEYLATARVARQCEMFAPYIGRCAVAICNDRRYRFKTYHKVFFGEELITWLCDERLVMNRTDGLRFGRQLMAGGVIMHVSNEHALYDNSRFFYKFNPVVLSVDEDGAVTPRDDTEGIQMSSSPPSEDDEDTSPATLDSA